MSGVRVLVGTRKGAFILTSDGKRGVMTLAFNYGAYMTEIFRAGIQAIPRGQVEAAQSLAMPEGLIMRRVILPQAVRIVIPAVGNEFIAMIKDSALVSFVTIQELFWRASTVGCATTRTAQSKRCSRASRSEWTRW